jgi:tight adherence protein B
MNPMISLILMFAALGIGAVACGVALFFFQRYVSPEPSPVQQRLERLKGRMGNVDVVVAAEQAKKVSRFYKDAEYKNENVGRKLEQWSFFKGLKLRMQQAGIKTPADKFFITRMLIPSVISTVIGVGSGFLILVPLGLVVAFGSYAFVLFKRKQRYSKFIAQLPDALSMITSALRAGHSFQSALTVVSTEMPDPISTEFASMIRDINLGIPVREALSRLVSKLDTLPDVRMFATAVTIQREAGGNLAEVLENLGYTIRERFKLKGQIAALTGQSRLTGYVLGAAPAIILTGLSIFMYSYVKPLYETDYGHLALGAVVVLQSIGFVVMRKIIDIRV